MIFVYTTAGTQEEADKLAQLILGARLGACINSWVIQSMYEWKGEIKKEAEVAMIIKTIEEKFQAIEELILENHSYENPCIVSMDIRRMNPEFKRWVLGSMA